MSELRSKQVALVIMFASFYLVLSLLPGVPVIGIPKAKIQLEAAVASVFGIFLGPYLGALTTLIGVSLASIYGGSTFFNLIFFGAPIFNSLISGFLARGRWRIAALLMGLAITGFWLTPISQPFSRYWYVGLAATYDKIAALLIAVVLGAKLIGRGLKLADLRWRILRFSIPVVTLIAFIGSEADASIGILMVALPPIYSGIFNLSLDAARALFLVSPFLYPIIYIIRSFIASAIILTLANILKLMGKESLLEVRFQS